jgi:cytochrome P450
MNMCDGAAAVVRQDEVKTEEVPSVFQQLSTAIAKDVKKNELGDVDTRWMVASEILDHLAAGFDTSAITLTFMIYQLSIVGGMQHLLQRELRSLSPRLKASSSPHLPDPKTLDALPVLHAIVLETLRLNPAIPGPQPRYTPPQGCQLGPNHEYFVPGGVRVSASAGLLHKNEEVYYNSKKFRPERWLNIGKVDEEKRKDMESRWFWAFGRSVYQCTLTISLLTSCSGGRMCVGSHLAVYRKYNISLHIDLASLIPALCICCSSIVI